MTRQATGASKENDMSETTTGTPYGAPGQAKPLYLQRVPRMPEAPLPAGLAPLRPLPRGPAMTDRDELLARRARLAALVAGAR
jgi:hypothetical protein